MKKNNQNMSVKAILLISLLAIVAFAMMVAIVPRTVDFLQKDNHRLRQSKDNPQLTLESKRNVNHSGTVSRPGTYSAFGTTGTEAITATETATQVGSTSDTTTPRETLHESERQTVRNTTLQTAQGTTESVPETAAGKSTMSTISSPVTEDQPEPNLYVDDAVAKIYKKVIPYVATIHVYMPATTAQNEKTAIFSGLIVSADGQVVTCASNFSFAMSYGNRFHHLAIVRVMVRGVEQVFEAQVEAVDRDIDMAILRLKEAKDLPVLTLRDRVKITIGEPVFAIGQGDLMMHEGMISPGYITGVFKQVAIKNNLFIGMIQTNAFISEQLSGAPLVNLKGEVVALCNTNLNRSYSDLMGYGMAASVVKGFLDETANPSLNKRAWLGVTVLSGPRAGELFKLMKWPEGLILSQVDKESPAFSGGIRVDDIITRINGKRMETPNDLISFLDTQPVGSLVEILVYRPSERRYISYNIYLGRSPR